MYCTLRYGILHPEESMTTNHIPIQCSTKATGKYVHYSQLDPTNCNWLEFPRNQGFGIVRPYSFKTVKHNISPDSVRTFLLSQGCVRTYASYLRRVRMGSLRYRQYVDHSKHSAQQLHYVDYRRLPYSTVHVVPCILLECISIVFRAKK